MTFDIQKSGSIRAPGDSHFGKFSPVRLAKCNRTILALSYWMTDNFAQLGSAPTLYTRDPLSVYRMTDQVKLSSHFIMLIARAGWCSGITIASLAEGLGSNPASLQAEHWYSFSWRFTLPGS